ncbi:MAG: hypothetical protein QNJ63_03785 [Calothrix sp. MO_192.B10]|nr:hypothetical protein [Calothrix sp. MO_192.B10]
MNAVLPRFLKLSYHKEPIISVLITMGVVDALIGGFDDSWSLFIVGLGTTGIALTWRWWRAQQRQPLSQEPVVQQQQPYYLPPQPSSSTSTLPMLSIPKKKPPRS